MRNSLAILKLLKERVWLYYNPFIIAPVIQSHYFKEDKMNALDAISLYKEESIGQWVMSISGHCFGKIVNLDDLGDGYVDIEWWYRDGKSRFYKNRDTGKMTNIVPHHISYLERCEWLDGTCPLDRFYKEVLKDNV